MSDLKKEIKKCELCKRDFEVIPHPDFDKYGFRCKECLDYAKLLEFNYYPKGDEE
jgi:hypothetical protein